jgi:hypothetical protein
MDPPMTNKVPLSVYAAVVFLFLNALIWLVFAILAAAGWHTALPQDRTVQWIMAGLAFGSACVLLALIVLLRRRIRIAYYLALGFLALLTILTIADEVGLADWIYLAIVAVPLILLIKDRAWYLPKEPDSEK